MAENSSASNPILIIAFDISADCFFVTDGTNVRKMHNDYKKQAAVCPAGLTNVVKIL